MCEPQPGSAGGPEGVTAAAAEAAAAAERVREPERDGDIHTDKDRVYTTDPYIPVGATLRELIPIRPPPQPSPKMSMCCLLLIVNHETVKTTCSMHQTRGILTDFVASLLKDIMLLIQML